MWRKVRAQRGCAVPRGRRGHTALVHRGQMLIYGGYQDLRGSSSELWAFHFGNRHTDLVNNVDSLIPADLTCSTCYRDWILALALVERERTGSETQAFGGFTRWRDVYLWRNDGSSGEERLLAMGRQQRLVVHAKEQTGTWTSSWSRSVQIAKLHVDLWRWKRRFGDERALEIPFRYICLFIWL